LQGRSRSTRERPFNARVTGNQPDFALVDLDANLSDKLTNDGASSGWIGRVESVGRIAHQASVVVGNAWHKSRLPGLSAN
jgi:hypothetical protein